MQGRGSKNIQVLVFVAASQQIANWLDCSLNCVLLCLCPGSGELWRTLLHQTQPGSSKDWFSLSILHLLLKCNMRQECENILMSCSVALTSSSQQETIDNSTAAASAMAKWQADLNKEVSFYCSLFPCILRINFANQIASKLANQIASMANKRLFYHNIFLCQIAVKVKIVNKIKIVKCTGICVVVIVMSLWKFVDTLRMLGVLLCKTLSGDNTAIFGGC